MIDETPLQGVPTAADLISAQEARREKRARRKNLRLVEPNSDASPVNPAAVAAEAPEAAEATEQAPTQKLINAELRRMSRETRQYPESSIRAERQARNAAREAVAEEGDVTGQVSEPESRQLEVEPVGEGAIETADDGQAEKAARRRANTAEKARRRNSAAASEENLLLVRQMSLTNQQLYAAHRVIGRLSAERDILRQHFADAVGIPVDEVVVATDTNSDETALTKVRVEAKPPSRLEKLNYFGGNDYAQMRRRRQTFVGALLAFVLVLWGLSRVGYLSAPANLSRDSLGQMPFIGDLMTYFLAGWLFFRVAKVSSKGVRWVFPSDTKQRRRR